MEGLAEDGANASLVGRERGWEMGDDEERRGSIGDPCVAGEVREPIDGGLGKGGCGGDHLGSVEAQGKVFDGVDDALCCGGCHCC